MHLVHLHGCQLMLVSKLLQTVTETLVGRSRLLFSNEGGISLSHKPDSLMFMAMSNGVKRKDRFFFLFLIGRKPKSEFRLREAVTFKCVKARTTAVSHKYITTCSTLNYFFSCFQNNKKYTFLIKTPEQNSCMINCLYWILYLILRHRLCIKDVHNF